MTRIFLLLFLIASSLLIGCAGSDENDAKEQPNEEDSDEEGLRMCCELGAICHVTGDSGEDDVAECHDIGHSNVPEDCRAEYNRCVEACVGANDDPVEHACE